MSYVLTGPTKITLSVITPRKRAVKVASATGRAGLNRISWNRRLQGRRAKRGTYGLVVSATQNGRTVSSRVGVRIR